MLGAYLAYSLTNTWGNLALAVVVGTLISVTIGWLLEKLLFKHFYHRSHLDQVLLTFGLIYLFEELRSMLWGTMYTVWPYLQCWTGLFTSPTPCLTPAYRLFMLVVCSALALGLWLLISQTKLGMKIRAGAFNHEMTEALGVNIKLIHALVFALGVGLATIAGMVAAPVSSVYPTWARKF